MRLYEITSLTKDQFTPKHRENAKAIGKDFGQEDQEELGMGMYATAFSTPQEPGTVRKVTKNPVDDLEKDAYFQYVSLIAKNDRMSSNPYFPKIFNIQVRSFYRKDFTGEENLGVEYVYAVDLERLLPFSSLSNKEARMLGNRIFYDFEKKYRPGRVTSGKSKIDYLGELSDRIEVTFSEDVFNVSPSLLATITKDRYYKQALLLIRAMIHKNDSMFEDMHDKNIMIRRGPQGPQIVITDPVMSH